MLAALEFEVNFKVRTRVVNREVSWENRTITLRASDTQDRMSWQHVLEKALPELCPQGSRSTLVGHVLFVYLIKRLKAFKSFDFGIFTT